MINEDDRQEAGMPDTAELLERAKNGDEAAFSELVQVYEPLMQHIIRRYGTGIEPDDLHQEVMLALYSAIGSYEKERNVTFGAYSKICMRNRILNIMRKQKKENQIEETFLPDEEADPVQGVITRESCRMLLGSDSFGLTELEKHVLRLYLADMSYEQIAASLQITEKSVDNAIYRMKAKLRKHM